jgi:dihydrofolate synthase/folylpolyglutamate synthase
MSALEWIESLSPWPTDGFGLARIRRVLADLGDPQDSFRAVHVVGTNGKSSTTRMIEALLDAGGVRTGSYVSPHVVRWAERIRVDGEEADFERAVGRIRRAAERAGATQFEALTAAAFAVFAASGVSAAVVEAGLGGRHDATNVLGHAVTVVLTNVGLEHTAVLGETREAIAAEKLAVIRRGARVVLGEPEWSALARRNGAAEVVVETGGNVALARAAAESFLGHAVDDAPARVVELPGRLEHVADHPLELWDGAHNPDGVRWLVSRLPARDFVLVASILADKDVDELLARLAARASVLVATTSANPRALPAQELGDRGRKLYSRVEIEPDPAAALAGARRLAGPDGAVLVCGSLYLLAELAPLRERGLPCVASANE